MAPAAPTTAPARAGAVSGARGSGNIDDLARGLAKKEQDPDKLTEAMTGLGYSKSEARAAAHRATGTTPKSSSSGGATASRTRTAPASKDAAPSGEDLPGKQGKPVRFTDTPAAPAFRMPSTGGSGSGLLIALVLYPAGLAFLRGGPAGLRAWFNAKFFNKVPGSAA